MTTRRVNLWLAAATAAALLHGVVSAAPPVAPGSAPSMTMPAPGTAEGEAAAWMRANLPGARLAGTGRLRWFGFHVYDARLWVGPEGYRAAGRDPATTPFVLELQYARKFSGVEIARASRSAIDELGYGTPEQRNAWLQAMERVFPDVQPGQRLAGHYRPGGGVRFFHEGRPVGSIDDPAFAHAFFAIWFDPRTPKAELRGRLLAQVAARS